MCVMVREACVEAVEEALDLLQSMVVFYCKYHLVPGEERVVIEHELKETYKSYVSSKKLVQQHVDILRWRMEELSGHFEAWISDEMVARKKWRVHPRDEFKHLLSRMEKVTVKMHDVIVQDGRVLLEGGEPRRRSSMAWCDPVEYSRKNSFNLSGHSLLPEKK